MTAAKISPPISIPHPSLPLQPMTNPPADDCSRQLKHCTKVEILAAVGIVYEFLGHDLCRTCSPFPPRLSSFSCPLRLRCLGARACRRRKRDRGGSGRGRPRATCNRYWLAYWQAFLLPRRAQTGLGQGAWPSSVTTRQRCKASCFPFYASSADAPVLVVSVQDGKCAPAVGVPDPARLALVVTHPGGHPFGLSCIDASVGPCVVENIQNQANAGLVAKLARAARAVKVPSTIFQHGRSGSIRVLNPLTRALGGGALPKS